MPRVTVVRRPSNGFECPWCGNAMGVGTGTVMACVADDNNHPIMVCKPCCDKKGIQLESTTPTGTRL